LDTPGSSVNPNAGAFGSALGIIELLATE